MPSVLVVEDSLTQSTQIRLMLKSADFEVYVAQNGREALEVLANQNPDVVLTDLQMPEMNGLQLVQALRDQYPHLPVVLMTQHGSEEIAMAALRQGAASYLPKSQLHQHLIGTLDDILESAQLADRQEQIQLCRIETQSQYRLENNPALIAPLAARIEQDLADQHFANPTIRRQIGVALRKAIDNATYHGNLELTEDDRADGELVLRNKAEQRRKQPPWCDRRTWVKVIIDEAEARFIVRDEGPGFDPSLMPHTLEAANLDELRGSGLLLIHTFMDRVEHNALGNEITMIKRRPLPAEAPPPQVPARSGGPHLFGLEAVDNVLVITVLSEDVGFAELRLPAELDRVLEHLADPGVRNALVDFSPVDYFGSAVLEVLRAIWGRVKERRGHLALCCLSPPGRDVLHLSRFDTLWPMHSSRTEALMALHSHPDDGIEENVIA